MGLISCLLDILFPPRCLFCQKILPFGAHGMCDDCRQTLQILDTPKRGDFFLKCHAPLPYEGLIREAIHRYKFGGRRDYAPELGKLMAECVRENLAGQFDVVTYVPVSMERRKERGYDQTELLAGEMGKCLDVEIIPTLEKTVDNQKQSTIKDRKKRAKNVKNVYKVTNREAVDGNRILLVDDIITTGSTLEETAKMLLKSGALSVVCIALAQPKK